MPTKKNIRTPEILYQHFESYKQQCKESPKKENFWSTKLDKQISVDREIPYTWNGFEIWLRKNGIVANLDDYKRNKDNRYTEYANIIRAINTVIYEDKITGATAGIFQHNIIARELGLSDKQQIDVKDDREQAIKQRKEELLNKISDAISSE